MDPAQRRHRRGCERTKLHRRGREPRETSPSPCLRFASGRRACAARIPAPSRRADSEARHRHALRGHQRDRPVRPESARTARRQNRSARAAERRSSDRSACEWHPHLRARHPCRIPYRSPLHPRSARDPRPPAARKCWPPAESPRKAQGKWPRPCPATTPVRPPLPSRRQLESERRARTLHENRFTICPVRRAETASVARHFHRLDRRQLRCAATRHNGSPSKPPGRICGGRALPCDSTQEPPYGIRHVASHPCGLRSRATPGHSRFRMPPAGLTSGNAAPVAHTGTAPRFHQPARATFRPGVPCICIDFYQYRCMSKLKPVPLCPAILDGELTSAQAETLANLFRALADPARIRLLSLIAAQPGAEACACHFTERLGLAQPTVSHHLKVLRSAGLLERERRGNWLYYRIVAECLATVSSSLSPMKPRRASNG